MPARSARGDPSAPWRRPPACSSAATVVEVASWRWIFLLNVPVRRCGASPLAPVARLAGAERGERRRRIGRLDRRPHHRAGSAPSWSARSASRPAPRATGRRCALLAVAGLIAAAALRARSAARAVEPLIPLAVLSSPRPARRQRSPARSSGAIDARVLPPADAAAAGAARPLRRSPPEPPCSPPGHRLRDHAGAGAHRLAHRRPAARARRGMLAMAARHAAAGARAGRRLLRRRTSCPGCSCSASPSPPCSSRHVAGRPRGRPGRSTSGVASALLTTSPVARRRDRRRARLRRRRPGRGVDGSAALADGVQTGFVLAAALALAGALIAAWLLREQDATGKTPARRARIRPFIGRRRPVEQAPRASVAGCP